MTSVYLSYRAISAYASIGIDITKIKGSLPITGFHFINEKLKVEVPLPSQGEIMMYSIDRHVLYDYLLNVASAFKSIKIKYDERVNDIDF